MRIRHKRFSSELRENALQLVSKPCSRLAPYDRRYPRRLFRALTYARSVSIVAENSPRAGCRPVTRRCFRRRRTVSCCSNGERITTTRDMSKRYPCSYYRYYHYYRNPRYSPRKRRFRPIIFQARSTLNLILRTRTCPTESEIASHLACPIRTRYYDKCTGQFRIERGR